jgi:hypothetical protein
MQGHRYGRGGNPEMDVRTAIAEFIHVHFDDAFAESVNTGDDDRASESERTFGEDDHGLFSESLV